LKGKKEGKDIEAQKRYWTYRVDESETTKGWENVGGVLQERILTPGRMRESKDLKILQIGEDGNRRDQKGVQAARTTRRGQILTSGKKRKNT